MNKLLSRFTGSAALALLLLLQACAAGGRPALPPVDSITVSGAAGKVVALDLAALQALPKRTQTAGAEVYTGTGLWTLLDSVAGIRTETSAMNARLAMYVVATGRDGYRAVFSLGELDPEFGNQPVLVVYGPDGKGLEGKRSLKLVVPGDIKRGRWVRDLIRLDVQVAPSAAAR